MKNLQGFIEWLTAIVGKAASWLSVLLVLVIVIDVFLRYFFNITSAASFELEWHLFAVIFLLGAGWALQQDRHVRVDVFYQAFSVRTKAWINLIGTVLMLLPFCLVGFWEGSQLAFNAYQINEVSPDPGGLPARYLIKSAIPVGFILLGLQGISIILTSIKALSGND